MQAAAWLMEPVVHGHQDDLRRQAAAFRVGREAGRPARRPGTRRERLGWWLVEVGLRLALPAEAAVVQRSADGLGLVAVRR